MDETDPRTKVHNTWSAMFEINVSLGTGQNVTMYITAHCVAVNII